MGHASLEATRRRPGLALIVLWCAAVSLLAGCLRYTADLSLAQDDTVSGTLVIAKKPPGGSDGDGAPASGAAASLAVPKPESSSERIIVERYSHRGQEGYKVTFDHATFADMGAFTPGGSRGGTLTFFRDGDQVKISMSIDLTYADNVDNEQITDSFEGEVALEVPGDVVKTNGEVSGNVIVWSLEPLAINSISATVDYPRGAPQAAADPGGGPPWWLWAVVGALAAAGLGRWLTRRRSAVPAPPVPTRQPEPEQPPAPRAQAAPEQPPAPRAQAAPEQPPATGGPVGHAAAYPASVPEDDDQALTAGGWPPPRPHWRS